MHSVDADLFNVLAVEHMSPISSIAQYLLQKFISKATRVHNPFVPFWGFARLSLWQRH